MNDYVTRMLLALSRAERRFTPEGARTALAYHEELRGDEWYEAWLASAFQEIGNGKDANVALGLKRPPHRLPGVDKAMLIAAAVANLERLDYEPADAINKVAQLFHKDPDTVRSYYHRRKQDAEPLLRILVRRAHERE